MNEIEEQFDKFRNDCINQARQEASKLEQQIAEKVNQQLNASLKEYREKEKIQLQHKIDNIQKEYYSNIFQMEKECKLAILEKKKEQKETIKQLVQEKLEQFVQGKEYFMYLEKNIKKAIEYTMINKKEDRTIIIYLTKKDIDRFSNLLQDKLQGISIQEIEPMWIGGCQCLNQVTNTFVDATLKSELEEKCDALLS